MPIVINVPGAVAYNQGWVNPGWIAALIPVLEDEGFKYFYGPNVANVRIFADPPNADPLYYSPDSDPANVDMSHPHIVRHIATYSTYAAYKTWCIIDSVNYDDDPDAYDDLDTALTAICAALSAYGFEYLGMIDSSVTDPETYLNTLLNDYFDSQ